jgi:hypothetical protein
LTVAPSTRRASLEHRYGVPRSSRQARTCRGVGPSPAPSPAARRNEAVTIVRRPAVGNPKRRQAANGMRIRALVS